MSLLRNNKNAGFEIISTVPEGRDLAYILKLIA